MNGSSSRGAVFFNKTEVETDKRTSGYHITIMLITVFLVFQFENGLRKIGPGKDRNATPLRDGRFFCVCVCYGGCWKLRFPASQL